jgi:hypothetical protein
MIPFALRLAEEQVGIDSGENSGNALETSSDTAVAQDKVRSRYRATLHYFSNRWNSAWRLAYSAKMFVAIKKRLKLIALRILKFPSPQA